MFILFAKQYFFKKTINLTYLLTNIYQQTVDQYCSKNKQRRFDLSRRVDKSRNCLTQRAYCVSNSQNQLKYRNSTNYQKSFDSRYARHGRQGSLFTIQHVHDRGRSHRISYHPKKRS